MNHESRIKFAFFGTPEVSVEILEHLKKDGLVPSLIVTNPDKPQGRKLALAPSPVKLWAIGNKIPFLQPENIDDPSFTKTLHATRYTLFLVVAYGKIIPKEILAIPKHGSLNIHYSLLPKYRGASPIESQILNDDKNTGVSILLLDEKMDHGPIISDEKLNIKNQKWEWPPKASELRKAMNRIAGGLLVKTIPLFVAGEIKAKEQNHAEATYTKKFTKTDGEINLSDNPYKNFLKIQAFDDSIGTYFFSDKAGKKIRVIIKSAEFKNGKLAILRVVPEGKKRGVL